MLIVRLGIHLRSDRNLIRLSIFSVENCLMSIIIICKRDWLLHYLQNKNY